MHGASTVLKRAMYTLKFIANSLDAANAAWNKVARAARPGRTYHAHWAVHLIRQPFFRARNPWWLAGHTAATSEPCEGSHFSNAMPGHCDGRKGLQSHCLNGQLLWTAEAWDALDGTLPPSRFLCNTHNLGHLGPLLHVDAPARNHRLHG